MCDALWAISAALGNKLTRYTEIINKCQEKVDTKTTQEVVTGIVDALTADIERRLKHGKPSV